MLKFIADKKDCTGCSACLAVCPVSCISMYEDEEGFLYPVSDERCIGCGKCERVCPIYSTQTERFPDHKQSAFAAVTNNMDVWKASTSGGAFTEICSIYGDQDTVVFGATFDGLKVVHTYVVGVENIGVFRKSKYVQSDMGNCFCRAEELLQKGTRVIFSGTPCQIAGLRSFLGQEYKKLLCIDLICHGVGSPKVFELMLRYLEDRHHSQLEKYTFRCKQVRFGNLKQYVSCYKFESGKITCVERDEYNQLFLSQVCLRKSCGENCRFRTANRMGDITIADFKGKDDIFPEMQDYRNFSTVVVNSKKGNKIISGLGGGMTLFPCDLEHVKKYNPLFFGATPGNPQRNSFFADLANGMNMTDLLHKYLSTFQGDSFLCRVRQNWVPRRLKMIWRRLTFTKWRAKV